jgi:hypothetical protein
MWQEQAAKYDFMSSLFLSLKLNKKAKNLNKEK